MNEIASDWLSPARAALRTVIALVSLVLIGGVALLAGAAQVDAGVPSLRCFGQAPTIVGTPEQDVLKVTRRHSVVATLGGDDRVHLVADDVRICAGGGRDRVKVEDYMGVNRIELGAGRDTVEDDWERDFGSPEEFVVRAGNGADWIFTGGFPDRVEGGRGDDHLIVWRDDDRVWAGPGDDKVYGGPESDRLKGGPGSDRLDSDLPPNDYYASGTHDFADGGEGFDGCEAETVVDCEKVID